jgi:hypothetical protein
MSTSKQTMPSLSIKKNTCMVSCCGGTYGSTAQRRGQFFQRTGGLGSRGPKPWTEVRVLLTYPFRLEIYIVVFSFFKRQTFSTLTNDNFKIIYFELRILQIVIVDFMINLLMLFLCY